MPKNIVLILFFVILLASCSQKKSSTRISSFHVSPKGDKIIFSWNNNVSRSILEVDSNGLGAKELVPGSTDTLYSNPRFNINGTMIVFIGKSISDGHSAIYVANSDGTEKKRITSGNDFISDVFYSRCESKIYFINSKSYDNYSPVSAKGLHNSDLYSISLAEKTIQKITNQAAYNMYKPSELNCDSLLMTISYPSLFGLTLIEKKNPNKLIKIAPINRPRQPDLYDSPTFSESTGLLFFLAPYEMYVMDWKKRKATMILRDDKMIENFRLIEHNKRIIYTNSVDNTFFITDFGGTRLRELKIGEL